MNPINTIWGPVFEEVGCFDPEYEYRLSPEAREHIAGLKSRMKVAQEEYQRSPEHRLAVESNRRMFAKFRQTRTKGAK